MHRAVYRCELIPKDFLFFVSNEFNTSTYMQPVIHNYALTYALARQFIVGFQGVTPRYEELETFENYATPAIALQDPKFVTHTYNSVCSRTNRTRSVYNIPSLGRNQKIMPESTVFQFLVFSVDGRIPSHIRVGKKSCISEVRATKLKIVEVVEDPSEPIDVKVCYNILDLSSNDIILSADMLLMYPSPVARSMTVRAPYFVLDDDQEQFAVPIPKHLRPNESGA